MSGVDGVSVAMITREEAERLVLDHLNADAPPARRAAVVDVWLKPYGWVFLYNSEAYVRDGNRLARFLGNGPMVVMHDRSIHPLGSATSAADEVASFERQRGLSAG